MRELPPGAQLQRELVALVDDGRKDARHLPGPVGQSNKATVADEELALQDVVGFLVSARHQVGVAQLVAKHQAKLGSFEHRLDDTEWLTLAQERVCPHRLKRDVNHLVGVEMAGQILNDLPARLHEQILDGFHWSNRLAHSVPLLSGCYRRRSGKWLCSRTPRLPKAAPGSDPCVRLKVLGSEGGRDEASGFLFQFTRSERWIPASEGNLTSLAVRVFEGVIPC